MMKSNSPIQIEKNKIGQLAILGVETRNFLISSTGLPNPMEYASMYPCTDYRPPPKEGWGTNMALDVYHEP